MSSSENQPSALLIKDIDTLSPERYQTLLGALGWTGLSVTPLFEGEGSKEVESYELEDTRVVKTPSLYELPANNHGETEYAITENDFKYCASKHGLSESLATRAWGGLLRASYPGGDRAIERTAVEVELDSVGGVSKVHVEAISFSRLAQLIAQVHVRNNYLPNIGKKSYALIEVVLRHKHAQIEEQALK